MTLRPSPLSLVSLILEPLVLRPKDEGLKDPGIRPQGQRPRRPRNLPHLREIRAVGMCYGKCAPKVKYTYQKDLALSVDLCYNMADQTHPF